jgi:hypothetical protein
MENIKQYNIGLFIVIVASSLLSLQHCPVWDTFFDDKEIFKYIAQIIYKGGVPYNDVFDHKPPLIYFTYLIYQWGGSWAFWFFDMLLVLSASVIFFNKCYKHNIPYAFVLPILFNAILRLPYVSFGIGNTREYTTIFYLLFFITSIGTLHLRKWLQMGILVALTFFMQQEHVAMLMPIYFYTLYLHKKTLLKNIGATILGFLIIALPIVSYFLINDAWESFINQAFLFNAKWYTQEASPNITAIFLALGKHIKIANLHVSFIISIVLAAYIFWKGHTHKSLLAIAILGLPLAFISEFMSKKLTLGTADCNYYLLPIATALPILLFTTLAYTKALTVSSNSIKKIALLAVLSIPLAYNVRVFYKVTLAANPKYVAQHEIIHYLQKDTQIDGSIYVVNNSAFTYAYNHFNIKAPHALIYHYFWHWYANWDSKQVLLQEIKVNLEQQHTKYIIIHLQPGNAPNTIAFNNFWLAYLTKNFTPVYKQELWKRK